MAVYKHQGKWRYDFQKHGRRTKKGGFKTRAEAMAAQEKAKINLKKMNSGFVELCEIRLRHLKQRRTNKYFKDNERLIKKLILLWHGKKEITKKDVEDFLNDTESNFVANKYLRFIKALFNFGIEMELLSDNPAQRIKYYPVHRQKKYIPPDEDVRKVLEMANNEQRMYLLVIINTLARVSEVNNLKWEDVHKDYLILKTRKSKNSNVAERMIPFNFTLTRVFSILEPDGTFVFKNARTGARYNYRSKFLKTLCTNAKVIPFGFHALRHYGATKLDQEGVALSDIQALLGHQQATTTNIYLQSIRKSLKEAVRKLDPPLIVTPIEIGEVR